MSKSTKKRTMIYSNVKENKKRAEEISRIKDDQINLDDEIIIGFSNPDKNQSNVKKKNSNNTTNKKKKKRKKSSKTKRVLMLVAKILLTICIIAGIIFVVCGTSFFSIKKISINISNEEILTVDRIKEKLQIKEGDNLLLTSKRKCEESIKSDPYIESVEIKKSFPNTIKINVTERSAMFQLVYNDKFVDVDNQGYILDIVEEHKDIVTVVGYESEDIQQGRRLEANDLKKLSDVIQIMQEVHNNNIEQQVTKIDIKSNNDYKLYFENDGKIAHIGDANSLNDKLSYVKKILEMESDYEGEIFVNVNLNNGEYPYFREKV